MLILSSRFQSLNQQELGLSWPSAVNCKQVDPIAFGPQWVLHIGFLPVHAKKGCKMVANADTR